MLCCSSSNTTTPPILVSIRPCSLPPCSLNLVPNKFDTPPSDQDDCLAINSGNNIKFLNNYCSGGHGISIGSIASGKVSAWSTPSPCVHSHSLPLLDSLECPHFQEHGRPLGERPPNQDGRRCDERLCLRRESRLRCCSFAPPTILWRYFIQMERMDSVKEESEIGVALFCAPTSSGASQSNIDLLDPFFIVFRLRMRAMT